MDDKKQGNTTNTLNSLYTDELIDLREKLRLNKDWEMSDIIRDILDSRLSFVFDTQEGYVVYHLTKNFFRKKNINHTNREYLEMRIKQDKHSEKLFDAWLASTKASAESKVKRHD